MGGAAHRCLGGHLNCGAWPPVQQGEVSLQRRHGLWQGGTGKHGHGRERTPSPQQVPLLQSKEPGDPAVIALFSREPSGLPAPSAPRLGGFYAPCGVYHTTSH